jgi:hypothetical protein
MFAETQIVTSTNTYNGTWITLSPGARYNITFLFSFESGTTGSLGFQVTNSTEQDRRNGTEIKDDLVVVDTSGASSPIAVNSSSDPTHNVHLRDITAGAVRWTYTNATGTNKLLTIQTVVARL